MFSARGGRGITEASSSTRDCAKGECDNRSDRHLRTQANLPAAIKADDRMWGSVLPVGGFFHLDAGGSTLHRSPPKRVSLSVDVICWSAFSASARCSA